MSDVIKFAENNKLKGLRTIINNLQLSCYNNIFDADRTSFFIGNSGAEFHILQNGGHGFGLEHETRGDKCVLWCIEWLRENGFVNKPKSKK